MYEGDFFHIEKGSTPRHKLHKDIEEDMQIFQETFKKYQKDFMYLHQYLINLVACCNSQEELLKYLPDDFKPKEQTFKGNHAKFRLSLEKFNDIVKTYRGFDLV